MVAFYMRDISLDYNLTQAIKSSLPSYFFSFLFYFFFVCVEILILDTLEAISRAPEGRFRHCMTLFGWS